VWFNLIKGEAGMNAQKIVTRISITITSIGLYMPVIAGIITPMLWLLPAWYIAWDIIEYIFPFYPIWGGLWTPIPYPSLQVLLPVILLIEFIVFLGGCGFFLWGLIELTRGRRNELGLVTTGPYRFVRHPQHLGLVILLLPVVLFNSSYASTWSGIRPGDILSWSLIVFLLLITADWEESHLHEMFGVEFEDYVARTPFIVLRVHRFPVPVRELTQNNRVVLYTSYFAIYWALISLILFLFSFAHLDWTL
jgi:protein-S-isoprenylcysteine O-methyltransferase Ste14